MKRILLHPEATDATGGAAPKQQQQQQQPQSDLLAENKRLKDQLAKAEAASGRAGKDETAIRKKMAAGLTREQAEAVVRNQARHEELKAKLSKKKEDAAG